MNYFEVKVINLKEKGKIKTLERFIFKFKRFLIHIGFKTWIQPLVCFFNL